MILRALRVIVAQQYVVEIVVPGSDKLDFVKNLSEVSESFIFLEGSVSESLFTRHLVLSLTEPVWPAKPILASKRFRSVKV